MLVLPKHFGALTKTTRIWTQTQDLLPKTAAFSLFLFRKTEWTAYNQNDSIKKYPERLSRRAFVHLPHAGTMRPQESELARMQEMNTKHEQLTELSESRAQGLTNRTQNRFSRRMVLEFKSSM